jgi:GT2 family glycosyltransferase
MVSVILVTYNSEKFIKETYIRLLKQTYKDIEIIIIDNNSKDSTIESIKQINKNQKIIKNTRNIGFARANNQGLKISKGEYILTLNHDLYLTPSYIQKIIEVMDKDLIIGSAQGIYYNNLQKTKIDSCGIYLNFGYSAKDIKRIPKENRSIMAACAAAAIYRRSALIDVGFFDIRFVSYYEDLDLGIRLIKEGYDNLFVKSAYCIHLRGNPNSLNNLKYSLINKYRLLKKYKMKREIKIAKIYDILKFPIYYRRNKDFIPEYINIIKSI